MRKVIAGKSFPGRETQSRTVLLISTKRVFHINYFIINVQHNRTIPLLREDMRSTNHLYVI